MAQIQLEPQRAERSQSDTGPARTPWGLLSLLLAMNVVNFVDRQLLASFANFIVPDLGLSATEFGLLTGLVFISFYATMGLVAGALADRFDRARIIGIALFFWSGLTAASGAARGFLSLAAPRALIGIGEASLSPSAMSLLTDRSPERSRSLVMAVYYLGVPIGVGTSLIVAGVLGPVLGWRNSFYLLGVVGAVLSIAAFAIRDPRRHAPIADRTAPGPSAIGGLLSALRTSKPLTLTIAGTVAVHFALGAAQFDQLWLVRERGFERAHIALVTGCFATFFGVAGNIFGGVGGDLWRRHTGQGRTRLLAWLLVLFAPIILAYRLSSPDSPWFWVGLAGSYFQLGAFYGPAFSSIQDHCPPAVRATSAAFSIMAMNVFGLGIGITGGGIAVDFLKAHNFDAPYTSTLVGFTCLSFLAIPLFFLASAQPKAETVAANRA